MLSVQDALLEAVHRLSTSDTARTDAEVLLGHVLDRSRAWLYSHPDSTIDATESAQFQALVQRRQQGEPVAYITGKRAFWELEFAVTPAVLIPRPETELLVEAALQLLDENSPASVADLGTGSGAIAISLAVSRSHWQLTAVDIDTAALAVAKANAAMHGATNVEFRHGAWCEGLAHNGFDLIAANPPYVEANDPHLQDGDLRFEPSLALQSDEQGFADLFAIAETAREHLLPDAWLLLEHGFEQHPQLCEKLRALGYTNVEGRKDLAGHWRMVQAQMPAA